MSEGMILKKIAIIYTDFPEKFGIPRQSGLSAANGKIVFEPEYRTEEALRGLKEYSYLWILWGFSEVPERKWKPTVRPPRLGGNKRVGVFATRSPFRPNPIGLSSVKLKKLEYIEQEGWVIWVSGVDMMNGTPIYDIKPYLPYVDSHEDALGGFAEEAKGYKLEVEIPTEQMQVIPAEKRSILKEILSQDPRPAYQKEEDRIYGMSFDEFEIMFQVLKSTLFVREIKRRQR